MRATHANPSPIVRAFDELRALNPSWSVEIGRPGLADASEGPLNAPGTVGLLGTSLTSNSDVCPASRSAMCR
jgi:hypothetical protein